jgi:hypothetical protein
MTTVAIFSADEDTVLLRARLREAGFAAIGAYISDLRSGRIDVQDFLGRHRPDVVLYDLPAHPDEELRSAIAVMNSCRASGIPCVLTAADVDSIPELDSDLVACILLRPCKVEFAQLAIRFAMGDADLEEELDRVDEDDDESGLDAA